MQDSPMLEALKRELRKRGAPASYVARFVGELAEHRQDLLCDLLANDASGEEANDQADQRMGEPVEVAKAAMLRMRRSSLVGRHRIIFLILLPALLLPISWIALLALAASHAGMLSPQYRVGTIEASSLKWIYIARDLCIYAAPATIGALFYLLARRKFCGRAWAWAPVLTAVVVSSALFIDIFPANRGSATARLILGVARNVDPLRIAIFLGLFAALEMFQTRIGDLSLSITRPYRNSGNALLARER